MSLLSKREIDSFWKRYHKSIHHLVTEFLPESLSTIVVNYIGYVPQEEQGALVTRYGYTDLLGVKVGPWVSYYSDGTIAATKSATEDYWIYNTTPKLKIT